MSALFYVNYKGRPVKFGADKKFDAVDRAEASGFISEADAWWAAYQHDLAPQFVFVCPASEKEAA